jgi:peptidoglycan/LPS O-acetylase OafA/YrhL
MTEHSVADPQTIGSRRRPELDGLRGLAILLVIYEHYVNEQLKPVTGSLLDYLLLPGRISGTGVDLFFLLSGYLIGGILIEHRESRSYFKTFYVRRVCRILPLYLVCLGSAYVIGGTIWDVRHPSLVNYLTFTQNFWMAAAGSFGGIALAATWSLAIEEQFYLTVPALIRFITAQRLLTLIIGCIVLAPVLRLVIYLSIDNGITYLSISKGIFVSHFLPFTRMDTLMLGVLTAWLHRRGFVAPRRLLYATLGVTGAGMLYVAWKDGGRTLSPWLQLVCYDWFALFYLSLLLLATQGRLRWLQARALTFTGVISYGLYLLHYPIFAMIGGGGGFGLRGAVLTIASAIVVFALATLSWHFFEAPLVRMGHRLQYEDNLSDTRRLVAVPAEVE